MSVIFKVTTSAFDGAWTYRLQVLPTAPQDSVLTVTYRDPFKWQFMKTIYSEVPLIWLFLGP